MPHSVLQNVLQLAPLVASGTFRSCHRRSSGCHREADALQFVPLKRTVNGEVARSILASPAICSLVQEPLRPRLADISRKKQSTQFHGIIDSDEVPNDNGPGVCPIRYA